MTILVTGATGSIGCHLVEELAGHRPLRLLVRPGRFASAHERMASLLREPARGALRTGAIEVVEGDVTELDPELEDRLAQGLDAVVHLAARTDFGDDELEAYRAVNIDGAARVAELCVRAGCPLVYVSTAHVSGDHRGTFAEDDLDCGQGHHNAYERSKLLAEERLRHLAAERGLPLAVFRPGVVLPDAPRQGLPMGPGPLVHLAVLAGLEGRAGERVRVLRYAGDPDGRLNLVPMSFVVRTLAAALERPIEGLATYHVTSGKTFRVAEIEAAVNAVIEGLCVRATAVLEDADSWERIVARRCAQYEPYLTLGTHWDRSALESAFEHRDGADGAWLERTFAAHLEAWRTPAADPVQSPRASSPVWDYFEGFLPGILGQRLVPGLAGLSAEFTVSVVAVGRWRLRIEAGRLTSSAPARDPAESFDYEIDEESFLEVAAARARASELFFDRRVTIRGDVYRALSTATALEEFFALQPWSGRVLPAHDVSAPGEQRMTS